MTKPTANEARQLLASIEQANREIVAALTTRLFSKYAVTGKHSDDMIASAVRAHRAAIGRLWQPAPDGISAAKHQDVEA